MVLTYYPKENLLITFPISKVVRLIINKLLEFKVLCHLVGDKLKHSLSARVFKAISEAE